MESRASEAVREYSAAVYRAAYACLGNRFDAEDVMQEVFLRYMRKAPPFSSREHEKAWLIRVAVNCSRSLRSSAWRRKVVAIDDCAPISVSDSEMGGESVLAAVQSLPPKQRLCVHLYFYEDMKIREIAEVSGMPENTVKSHLHRAKETLSQVLKEENDV